MTYIPFTLTPTSVSVFINGKMRTLSSTMKGFDELCAHLKLPTHDVAYVEGLIDIPTAIARWSNGLVSVYGSSVYFMNKPVRSSLCEKMLQLLNGGYDVTPWANFLVRIEGNPTDLSRQSLFDFLDHWQVPITDDGCFIAFKSVRPNYLDHHSGTFDNSPGNVVFVERHQVDPDPDRGCSHGLHVCASIYLDGYQSYTDRIVLAVKVDPHDVVSVPTSYDKFAKMRVCRYEVIGEVEDPSNEGRERIQAQPVFSGEGVRVHNKSMFAREEDYAEVYEDEDDDFDYDTEGASTYAMYFDRKGVLYSSREILDGVADLGQRGYSKDTGIPRSTLQDWLARIRDES